ncbi:serine/arginine repetitive matrix protein 2 isoform X3 [Diabrotica virgifera virgifera]|uniref:DUF4780 domain-containing protein n=1 Tax=Diabrotica virgifera virgifera TaxID=50390 RepID=A0ABM5JNL7_DIAVI|nr:serine/arginine repetitive matrix protein 2 isoform X3 [Diabrotica virgifera virgifera]
MDPWDYFQKFQAQNSESENPSQQGAGVKKQRKRPPPGERRKAIIEKVLAANSALLSETEKKVVGSIFSQSDGQSTTCIRDPFKRTNFANSAILRKDPVIREWSEIYGKASRTYDDKDRNRKARYEEDRNGRYCSGTKQPETMAESFSRKESNMYRRTSPLGYDRASNSYGQIPSREMNTFGGERSQVHRDTRGRSPFTSERSQQHRADRRRSPEGIGRNDIRRETHGRSPPTSERSRFGHETRGRSPPTSQRNRFGHETRGRSPPTSERSRFGHETRGRSPPTSERSRFGHETRGRSPPTSERSRFGHETRGRSPPTSQRNRFGHETRGRSPPTSERSRFGHETRGRSPPTSERSRFGHEIRGRSPPTNERSRSGQETRGRSFLDRNRSSDNIRDAKNVSRERGTRIDERIDFRAPRDNPYEPDRIERYQDRSRYPGEDIAASSNSEAELRYGRGVGGNYNALMDNQNLDYIRDDIDLYAGEHDVPYYRDEMEDKNRSLQMELENKTIVVPEHFPRKRFTAFTAKIFDGLVLAHIASVIPEGMLRPQIEHGVFTGGAYVITTKDPYSKGWLEDMIPKLKGHQGTSMRVADIKELSDTAIKTMMAPKAPTPAAASAPKQVIKKVSTTSVIAVLWLRQKKFTDSPDVVLSKLATQNPGLVTSHWSFMVQQGNRKKGLTMQFKINTKDVTSLQRINMRPTLDDKQLKITIRPLKFTVKVKK